MNTSVRGNVERRDFLKTAATAATAFSILPARAVFGFDANSKVEIGIAGCGGRGSWIGRLFEEHGNAKVVAVHDYFQDRIDRAREMFSSRPNVPYQLDGYQALVSGSLDAVAVEAPISIATVNGGAGCGQTLYRQNPSPWMCRVAWPSWRPQTQQRQIMRLGGFQTR